MAMGSRRTTPTAPVAAAVVSEAMMEPTNTPLLPVAGLVDQRRGLGAAAAEDDGGDRHALGIVKLGADAGAVLGRSGEAAVGMRALLGRGLCRSRDGPSSPSAFSGGFLSRPSHHTVLSSRLWATLVKMVSCLGGSSGRWGWTSSLVPGATPKKPFSGLIAHRRPSWPMRSQAMSSPTHQTF